MPNAGAGARRRWCWWSLPALITCGDQDFGNTKARTNGSPFTDSGSFSAALSLP